MAWVTPEGIRETLDPMEASSMDVFPTFELPLPLGIRAHQGPFRAWVRWIGEGVVGSVG